MRQVPSAIADRRSDYVFPSPRTKSKEFIKFLSCAQERIVRHEKIRGYGFSKSPNVHGDKP